MFILLTLNRRMFAGNWLYIVIWKNKVVVLQSEWEWHILFRTSTFIFCEKNFFPCFPCLLLNSRKQDAQPICNNAISKSNSFCYFFEHLIFLTLNTPPFHICFIMLCIYMKIFLGTLIYFVYCLFLIPTLVPDFHLDYITLYLYSKAPSHWLPHTKATCKGRMISISENRTLQHI